MLVCISKKLVTSEKVHPLKPMYIIRVVLGGQNQAEAILQIGTKGLPFYAIRKWNLLRGFIVNQIFLVHMFPGTCILQILKIW